MVRKERLMLKKAFRPCGSLHILTSITHHKAVKDSFDVAWLLKESQYIQDKDDADLTE